MRLEHQSLTYDSTLTFPQHHDYRNTVFGTHQIFDPVALLVGLALPRRIFGSNFYSTNIVKQPRQLVRASSSCRIEDIPHA